MQNDFNGLRSDNKRFLDKVFLLCVYLSVQLKLVQIRTLERQQQVCFAYGVCFLCSPIALVEPGILNSPV